MKKNISIALLVALGISFNACSGGGGGDSGTPPSAPPGDTEAPQFTSSTMASVEENQLTAITLTATDTTDISYSIDEDDAALFDVNATSGEVTFKVAPDYEDNHNGDHTYSFTATATDTSANASSQSTTITILYVEPVFVYSEVTSPNTGKVWLDRNLGATQVCTALDDENCYGDYYQWGRNKDGHQLHTSTRSTVQATDVNNTGSNEFIVSSSTYQYDWAYAADTNGSLRAANWSKTDGTSICPVGFRVPTIEELKDETINAVPAVGDKTDAFNSFLKLPSSGYRIQNGPIYDRGQGGYLRSVDITGVKSEYLFYAAGVGTNTFSRTYGFTVRCIKD